MRRVSYDKTAMLHNRGIVSSGVKVGVAGELGSWGAVGSKGGGVGVGGRGAGVACR